MCEVSAACAADTVAPDAPATQAPGRDGLCPGGRGRKDAPPPLKRRARRRTAATQTVWVACGPRRSRRLGPRADPGGAAAPAANVDVTSGICTASNPSDPHPPTRAAAARRPGEPRIHAPRSSPRARGCRRMHPPRHGPTGSPGAVSTGGGARSPVGTRPPREADGQVQARGGDAPRPTPVGPPCRPPRRHADRADPAAPSACLHGARAFRPRMP